MNKITKDDKIAEVIEKNPKTAEVFHKNGFPCIGCAMAKFETIEEGATVVHGKDEKFLKKLVQELNKVTKNRNGNQ